jgi:hypothetical protein
MWDSTMRTTTVRTKGRRKHLLLTNGAVSVRIYTGKPRRKAGKTYEAHYLTYRLGGQRTVRSFSDIKTAKREAELILTQLINGNTAALDLTAADRQTYTLATAALSDTGTPLLPAVQEYTAALKLLGGKTTVLEAVKRFVATEIPDIPTKTVAEVVAEMVAAKLADHCSPFYLRNLKSRLNRFAKAFPGPISNITTRQIEDWLRTSGFGPRNRNNHAGVIGTAFAYARRAGYLPDRPTAAERLAKARVPDGDIPIYTVAEIRQMLNRLSRFRPELVPIVALGAFAGLRTAEIERLEWEDIRLDDGFIHIAGRKSKTVT